MSSVFEPGYQSKLAGGNVTTRRDPHPLRSKMAARSGEDFERDGSLLIEQILSQDEAKDVISMLSMVDELGGLRRLPSFCTSTQMGKREARLNLGSPHLSPISMSSSSQQTATWTENDVSEKQQGNYEHWSKNKGNGYALGSIYDLLEDEGDCDRDPDKERKNCSRNVSVADYDLLSTEVNDRVVREGADPLTQNGDTKVKTIKEPEVACAEQEDNKGSKAHRLGEDQHTPEPEQTDGGGDTGGTGEAAGSALPNAGADVNTSGDGEDTEDDNEGEDVKEPISPIDARIKRMDTLITLLDARTNDIGSTVRELESSLDYSHKEIEDLKKENSSLRQLLGNLEIEDRRTQYQVKDVEDRMDRMDTVSKKRNLVIEGLPETTGKREDTEKVIGDLFDQMNVNRGIQFEACYRIGPFDKSRVRPILVSFERMADRDLVYTKRFDLKRSADYHKVWINEDLNPASKRKRELLRMITKEAQQQSHDCRPGKYAIHIDQTRFDDNNLDDLPQKLQPANLKQVRINRDSIAYQSEHAPLSNFYPSQVTIGKHRFFCVEQAFRFLKAKTLNKPLIATRIYLSRDVRFIKQQGREAGTSEEWEARQFDYMYICLKKKFDQNAELKEMLLRTGTLELVEATPDRLWGCGATLSSNILRKREWVGQNKHGKILMTVREDLRHAQANHTN